jgi:hypothetical protein
MWHRATALRTGGAAGDTSSVVVLFTNDKETSNISKDES